MSSTTTTKRDQRIADEAIEDRAAMCSAVGCPNRWSVSREGSQRLCSAHAWVDSRDWPQVTAEQQDAQAERIWRESQRSAEAPARGLSKAEKVAILRQLRNAPIGRSGGVEWAHRLRECEERHGGILPSGQRMTPFQREAWRRALRDGFTTDSEGGEE